MGGDVASELACTIVDDLLSKERVRWFSQNLRGNQLVLGQQAIVFIRTIDALEMPFLALPYLPGNILENLRSEGAMRNFFFKMI